jgi:hypothetical protein
MTKKIMIALEQNVACPKCSHTFPLPQGITQQTIEHYESELDEIVSKQRKEMEERLAREAERRISTQFEERLKLLTEQLQGEKEAAEAAKKQVADARAEARKSVTEEFELQRQSLQAELNDKSAKIKNFQEQELALRAEKKVLEESRQAMELELQRKLDEERKKLHEQIQTMEADKFRLKEAELRKQLDDARQANEELTRKLDKGSQQLQGEVLELEVEHTLEAAFRHDRIEEVKKGQRGADVIQKVCTPTGQACGKIIWEAKRAENWSDKWLQKLKDDQQEAGAELAVLVTTAMPKGSHDTFTMVGDVWVISPNVVRPMAETLRVILLEMHRLRSLNSGRSEKMELIFNYLASPQFTQRVRSMLESFEGMRTDLESEKRAMQKIWAKRQTQLERLTVNMVTVVGELQAIAQDALPGLERLETLDEVDDFGLEDATTHRDLHVC